VSIFDELFNPSARFREEEKRRLEWMRDEEGEGDPYRGPIDLAGGVVRIKRAETTAEDRSDQEAAEPPRPLP
jgi:hypothetical protein